MAIGRLAAPFSQKERQFFRAGPLRRVQQNPKWPWSEGCSVCHRLAAFSNLVLPNVSSGLAATGFCQPLHHARGRWRGYNPREPLVIALRTLPHITSGSTQEDYAAQTRADLHARARFQSFASSCGHGLKGQHSEWRVSIHAPKGFAHYSNPFVCRKVVSAAGPMPLA
jgi:hypothetical protein